MDLYFFTHDALLLRRNGGPLHRFSYDWALIIKHCRGRDDYITVLTPLLIEKGFSEASSQGEIGSFTYWCKGVQDVDVSGTLILSDGPLTNEEIEERTSAPFLKPKALFRCIYDTGVREQLPRHLPGFGPAYFMVCSTTTTVPFWVDPDQKEAAEAALAEKGWKPKSHWTVNRTTEQVDKEREELKTMLITRK